MKKIPRWKKQAGPTKYSGNVRITCRFDYQPDICKDWKETGYCGYGDSCKFLHDRGDYKTGWQLEREFVEEEKRKREAALAGKEYHSNVDEYFIGDDDNSLPFACFICKQQFTNPVVTRCKHYFCENCATERHQKDPRCACCGENTSGIFNVAHDILKKMKEVQPGEQKTQDMGEKSSEEDGENNQEHDHNHNHSNDDDDHSNDENGKEDNDENSNNEEADNDDK